MQVMQAKLSVSLLRYIGTIPADRAFYEAGMACKQVFLPQRLIEAHVPSADLKSHLLEKLTTAP